MLFNWYDTSSLSGRLILLLSPLISVCSRFNNGWVLRYSRKYSYCRHIRSRRSHGSPKKQYTSYTSTPQLPNQYRITPKPRALAEIAQTYSRYVDTRTPCWKTTWCPSKFEVYYMCLMYVVYIKRDIHRLSICVF